MKTLIKNAALSTGIFIAVTVLTNNVFAQGISPAQIKVIASGDKVLVKFKVVNKNSYRQQYSLSVDGRILGTLAPMAGNSEKRVNLTLKARRNAIVTKTICITPKRDQNSRIVIPVCVKAIIKSASYIRKEQQQ